MRDERKRAQRLKNVMQTVFTLIFQLLHIRMSQKVRVEGQVSADTQNGEATRRKKLLLSCCDCTHTAAGIVNGAN